ncbi:MAG: hypothetical protein Q4D19_06180 [Lautropia sp.]|nr:hypothetical protein [Lautropia sp.]
MVPLEIPAGSGRRLAALHHPPAGARTGRAVLVINPFGQEAVRAHRLLRVLADRLSRLGVDVLRVDLHGCGDSSGDDLDGDMTGWQNDVLAAHRWLVDHVKAEKVGWLGIRLGFAIAWQAAARFGQSAATVTVDDDSVPKRSSARDRCMAMLTEGPGPERLIGWDPVVVGRGYLDALWQDHQKALRRAFSLPTIPDRLLRRQEKHRRYNELMGFRLSSRLVRQIADLDKLGWREMPVERVAAIESNGAISWPPAKRPAGLELVQVNVDFDWTSEEALNTPLVPDVALRQLLPWLSGVDHA